MRSMRKWTQDREQERGEGISGHERDEAIGRRTVADLSPCPTVLVARTLHEGVAGHLSVPPERALRTRARRIEGAWRHTPPLGGAACSQAPPWREKKCRETLLPLYALSSISARDRPWRKVALPINRGRPLKMFVSKNDLPQIIYL